MTHYRIAGTTRGQGLLLGTFAGVVGTLAGIFLWVIRSDPSREIVIAYLIAILILLICAWIVAFCIHHVIYPQATFVEITEELVSWRDWNGFGMQAMSYPISTIKAVKRCDESPDCLVFKDGMSVALPTLLIPDQASFNQVLTRIAPEIEVLAV